MYLNPPWGRVLGMVSVFMRMLMLSSVVEDCARVAGGLTRRCCATFGTRRPAVSW